MIYLDNNATTPTAPEVAESILAFLRDEFGNPSSSYQIADVPRNALAKARSAVAALIGASDPSEIVFTSGGTESDNWAIRGALAAIRGRGHVITTRVEHEAVRKLCESMEQNGTEVSWLDVDSSGMIDLGQLRGELREDTAIVSIMLANNETGVIFPVAEAAEIVKQNSNALFHTDAVNAAGKIPIDVKETKIDLLSLSAHKFHGPKGVGALYIRNGVSIPSGSVGGGQEAGRRAGTEAVHQVAGMGKAAEIAADLAPMEQIRHLRDRLEEGILRNVIGTRVNAADSPRLPNTSNISFESVNGEMLLAELSDRGIFVSTGSACNASGHSVSPVLKAMDVPFGLATGSIRFSLGRGNTQDEIDELLDVLPPIVQRLRRISGAQ